MPETRLGRRLSLTSSLLANSSRNTFRGYATPFTSRGENILSSMTLDAVINRMYASMSFERGGRPDWAGQRDVFAPHARLVRVTDEGVFEFDPQGFRHNLRTMIDSGVLPSFYERELWRDAHVYGDIAHVLSAYEMRSSRDGDVLCRAIKSIQLFQQGGRWWISAMIWRRGSDRIHIDDAPPHTREHHST